MFMLDMVQMISVFLTVFSRMRKSVAQIAAAVLPVRCWFRMYPRRLVVMNAAVTIWCGIGANCPLIGGKA